MIPTSHHSTKPGQVQTTLNDADTRSVLTKLGIDVGGITSEELAAYIKSQIPKWAAIIAASGTKLD